MTRRSVLVGASTCREAQASLLWNAIDLRDAGLLYETTSRIVKTYASIAPALEVAMNRRRSAAARAYRVQVRDRAVGILDTLADRANDLVPAEIAERLSLHKR